MRRRQPRHRPHQCYPSASARQVDHS